MSGVAALPLAGTVVLAVEHSVAGPYCSRLLADWGAEVIKVERPIGGDFARHWDTAVDGLSSYFVWLNRGKRSVAIDLGSSVGREVLARLIRRADVVMENMSPQAAARAGLDASSVHAVEPGVVHCAISGYGADGPYAHRKAYDLLMQGETGIVSMTGDAEHPAKVGISVCDIGTGMHAAVGILTALVQRARTGRGVALEVTMLDAMLDWVGGPLTAHLHTGAVPQRRGLLHHLIVPYGPFLANDGVMVSFAVETPEEWRRFCVVVMDDPALSDDVRFADNAARVAHRDLLEEMVGSRCAQLASADLELLLESAALAYGRIRDLAGVSAHAQAAWRRCFVESRAGDVVVRGVRNPVVYDGATSPAGDVPALGEHTLDVLVDLGWTIDEAKEIAGAAASAPGRTG
jgi:itaconate CoA-transferase